MKDGGAGSASRLARGFALGYSSAMLQDADQLHPSAPLKLLPAYLGTSLIEEAVRTVRGRRLLWLEILVNDRLDVSYWIENPVVQEAYTTACRWYTHYRRVITHVLNRVPLPLDAGPIDDRDYRTFAEALQCVSRRS